MTSPGGASRYYEVNYVLIPCLLIQTGLSRGIWSMPKSDISISAELVISRHGITGYIYTKSKFILSYNSHSY